MDALSVLVMAAESDGAWRRTTRTGSSKSAADTDNNIRRLEVRADHSDAGGDNANAEPSSEVISRKCKRRKTGSSDTVADTVIFAPKDPLPSRESPNSKTSTGSNSMMSTPAVSFRQKRRLCTAADLHKNVGLSSCSFSASASSASLTASASSIFSSSASSRPTPPRSSISSSFRPAGWKVASYLQKSGHRAGQSIPQFISPSGARSSAVAVSSLSLSSSSSSAYSSSSLPLSSPLLSEWSDTHHMTQLKVVQFPISAKKFNENRILFNNDKITKAAAWNNSDHTLMTSHHDDDSPQKDYGDDGIGGSDDDKDNNANDMMMKKKKNRNKRKRANQPRQALPSSSLRFIHHCSFCRKGFRFTTNFRAHERTHTGEKIFVCEWKNCEKRFAHPASLQAHIAKHKGIKPFSCVQPGCTQKFANKSNLNRHMRRIHGLTTKGQRLPDCVTGKMQRKEAN